MIESKFGSRAPKANISQILDMHAWLPQLYFTCVYSHGTTSHKTGDLHKILFLDKVTEKGLLQLKIIDIKPRTASIIYVQYIYYFTQLL